MKLTSISAGNLKGRTFAYDLGDATAIVGPNFAGKTAIIQAIILALKGYLPEVGKLPKATWELSSGERMTVEAVFTEREGVMSTLRRDFWLEGATVKAILYPPNFYDGELENIPLLDAERYFGMTDSERTNYLFERIKLPDTYTAEGIIAECERLSLEEEHSEAVEKAKAGWLVDVRLQFDQGTVQEALTAAIDSLKIGFTHWNKRAKDTTGAVKTLTELKLKEKEISTDSLRQLDKDIEEAQAELARVNQEKGRLVQLRDTVERAAANRRRIEEMMSRPAVDYVSMISKLETQKARAEKDLRAAQKAIEDVELADLTSRYQRAQTDLAEVTKIKTEAAQTIKEADRNLMELAHAKTCPFCKSSGPGWKAHLRVELDAKLEDAGKASGEANVRAAELTEQITEVTAQIKLYEQHQATIKALTLEIRRQKADLETLKIQKDEEVAKRKQWQEDLKALDTNGSAKKIERQISDLEVGDGAVARQALVKLTDRQKMATQLAQDLKRASQAQLEHLDAAAHVLVIKALGKLLNQKREGIIEEVFTTLLKTANLVVDGILLTPLALHENTIGRWCGPKFIPHRVFSGTEKALTYIAIAVALSSQAPLRLAILDEFGRLDKANKVAVMRQLALCLEQDVIDQFIVVGTTMPTWRPFAPMNITVIEVKS